MILQRFGFRESPYERPNQDWICRRALEGKACDAGPTPDGRCTASFECYPQRTGERWLCTRDALGGGPCEEGPRPDGICSRSVPRCLPVLRLNRRRSRTVRWWTLSLLGILLVLISGRLQETFISPGDLSTAHGSHANECSDCHSATGKGLWGWLTAAFTPEPGTGSQLCLNCHRLGDAPLDAHTMKPQTLKSYTQATLSSGTRQVNGLSTLIPAAAAGESGSLACVRCHREHQGSDARLIVVSDPQCQVCHTRQFSGFADSHPEFHQYTKNLPNRIIFEHDSHKNEHHPEWGKRFVCTGCHVPDIKGESMRLMKFDQACGNCHDEEIGGEELTGHKGLAVFGVPGLDLNFIEERALATGEWPEDADGEITPFMALLLSTDPEYRRAAPRLSNAEDLRDLSEADRKLAKAVETFAWSVKRLFHELALGGHEALQDRLEEALDQNLNTADLADLSGRMPAAVLAMALSDWFPNLGPEIQRRDAGEELPFNSVQPARKMLQTPLVSDRESMVTAGGWYRNGSTLYYRPAVHGDGFSRRWLESFSRFDDRQHSPAEEAILGLLTDPETPGRCAKCHRMDTTDEGGFVINWTIDTTPSDGNPFTRFSHKPHPSPAGENGCLRCHQWRITGNDSSSNEKVPTKGDNSFLKPVKSICTECHRPGMAGVGCLNCHNYHVYGSS